MVLDVFLRSNWDMDLCPKINCITCDADAEVANRSAIRNDVERVKRWPLLEDPPFTTKVERKKVVSKHVI